MGGDRGRRADRRGGFLRRGRPAHRLSRPAVRAAPVTRRAAVLVTAFILVAGSGAAPAAAVPGGSSALATGTGDGYRLLGGDGGVFAFGVPFAGSAAADPARCPPNTTDRQLPDGTCWSMASTRDGLGYWILNGSTGELWPFGTAADFGSPAARFAGAPRDLLPDFVSIVPTPDGGGYWVLARGLSGLGSVLTFGDARFYGDETSAPGPAGHTGQPVALAATPAGDGYWIVDSDGGVFTFGSAPFCGSMGGMHLDSPVVGAARSNDGAGYWLVGADGGVFGFGDARYAGSMAGTALASGVVGMAADPGGAGYWLAGADGGVFAFGGAPYLGSMAGTSLARPVFAVAAGRAQG